MRQNETVLSPTWQPQRSESYAADCAAGRIYARQVIAAARSGDHALLGGTLRAMVKAELFEGFEVGFAAEISEAL